MNILRYWVLKPSTRYLFALLGLVLLAGCARLGMSVQSEDSWLREEPLEAFEESTEKDILPTDRVYAAATTQAPEAERLLARDACVEITYAKVEILTGKRLPREPGLKPFLVRALKYVCPASHFECSYFRGKLLVAHLAMASYTPPTSRQALVLLLPRRPSRVAVSCSVME